MSEKVIRRFEKFKKDSSNIAFSKAIIDGDYIVASTNLMFELLGSLFKSTEFNIIVELYSIYYEVWENAISAFDLQENLDKEVDNLINYIDKISTEIDNLIVAFEKIKNPLEGKNLVLLWASIGDVNYLKLITEFSKNKALLSQISQNLQKISKENESFSKQSMVRIGIIEKMLKNKQLNSPSSVEIIIIGQVQKKMDFFKLDILTNKYGKKISNNSLKIKFIKNKINNLIILIHEIEPK